MKKALFALLLLSLLACDESGITEQSVANEVTEEMIDQLHYLGVETKLLKESTPTLKVFTIGARRIQSAQNIIFDFNKSEVTSVNQDMKLQSLLITRTSCLHWSLI